MNGMLNHTASSMVALGNDDWTAHTGALQQLWALTYREAQTQSFGDVYLYIMVAFVIAILLGPLMRKVTPPKAPSADAH